MGGGHISEEDAAILKQLYSKQGLNANLTYTPGGLIHHAYEAYKAAEAAYEDAMKDYNQVYNPVHRKADCDRAVHRELARLAALASDRAARAAKLREEFNNTYKTLLLVKKKYRGHVNRAKLHREWEKVFLVQEHGHMAKALAGRGRLTIRQAAASRPPGS